MSCNNVDIDNIMKNMNNASTGIDTKTMSQLNTLIESSTNTFLCPPGSECEKQRTTKDLYKKYLDAQTNVKVSPNQLQLAEKNYYTYSLGELGYNNYEDGEYGKKADIIIKEKTTEFNKNSNLAKNLNNNLKYLLDNLQNVTELYNNYIDENSDLKEKIIQSGSDIGTNDRKTYYEKQNLKFLLNWYSLWSWVYFILLIIFFIMIFTNTSNYSFYIKLLIFLFFIFYKYIFNYILLHLIYTTRYIDSILPKNTNI